VHNYTNLRLCNDTIIVLKITLLPTVSVITISVIPKRDKQTKTTRNQYASRPRGNAIPAGHVQILWAFVMKFCVAEGLVDQGLNSQKLITSS